MVGIGGVFGTESNRTDEILQWLTWSERESSDIWNDNTFSVVHSNHSNVSEEYPIQCNEGLLWLWGRIHSHRVNDNYINKSAEDGGDLTHGEYARDVINEYGIQGVSRLNGQFSGILFDDEAEKILLFTDRLGSKPIYYCVHDNGLIFSSNIQSFSTVHLRDVEFDLPPLYEFMTFGRALGLNTPIKGVKALPPGSISTFDLTTGEFHSDTYWRPTYNPKDKSVNYFVNELNDILDDVVSDIYDEQNSYGLLLSGGSDSRILSDLVPERIDCYHMNDWMNREAQIAKEVAETTDNNFVFLERDIDHYSRVLEQGADICNFTSWFEQGHILGYNNLDFPDYMLTGQFSDTVLGGYHYPRLPVSIPILNKQINTPFLQSVDSVDKYIELWLTGELGRNSTLPEYLHRPPNLEHILEENIHSNECVSNHNVKYGSLYDMVNGYSYYPLSNTFTFFMYESINEHVPLIPPFLDYRVLDLAQTIPFKHQVRGKIVDRAIKNRNKSLSSIKYPKTEVSLNRHPYFHYLSRLILEFEDSSPEQCKDYCKKRSPWVDHSELIRTNSFLFDYIDSKEDFIESLPFVDEKKVNRMCDEHKNGRNNRLELYALGTLISAPLTSAAVEDNK